MDLELTEEQRMLADSARAFVSEELLPHENEVEKQGEVPSDLGQQITCLLYTSPSPRDS